MSLPSYPVIADKVGIHLCRGITPMGMRCFEDHKTGSVTWEINPPSIHWSDRQQTHAGIKRFVELIVRYMIRPLPDEPGWHLDWRRARYVYRLAFEDLSVRLPRSLFDLERARLRGQLLNVPTSTPDRMEAMAWAKRR